MRYKTEFSDEELEKVIGHYSEGATEILDDPVELEKFIMKFRKWLRKGKKIPVLGRFADDLATMTELVEDYHAGIYKNISKANMVILVAVFAYVLSPIDLIPDMLPIIGYVDDATIIMFALKMCLTTEIDAYKSFRFEEKESKTKELCGKMTSAYEKLLGDKYLYVAIITADNKIRFLIGNERFQESEEIECYVRVYDIPNKILGNYNINSYEIFDLYKSVIKQIDPKVSIFNEDDFEEISDKYVILEED